MRYSSPVRVIKIFDAVTIAASGSSDSDAIFFETEILNDLQYLTAGYFSLQIHVTGDGTTTASYLLSNDGSNYLTQTGGVANTIATGLTKTSGGGSDGKVIYSISPACCKSLKIRFTETGAANSVTINAWLAIQ